MASKIHAVYDYRGIRLVISGIVDICVALMFVLAMSAGLTLRFVLRNHPGSLGLFAVENLYELFY